MEFPSYESTYPFIQKLDDLGAKKLKWRISSFEAKQEIDKKRSPTVKGKISEHFCWKEYSVNFFQ